MRRALSLILRIGAAAMALVFVALGGIWTATWLRNPEPPATLNQQAKALSLARHVAQRWRGDPPGAAYFGAFYSRRLPALIRLPIGLLEAATGPGECSGQMRGLVYLLSRQGIEARQFDIFAPTFTHTAMQAHIGGRWVLLDPYLGVAYRRADGQLAGFADIRANLPALTPVPLFAGRPPRIAGFYDRLDRAVGAFSGDQIRIPIWIDGRNLPLSLGDRDGLTADVERKAVALKVGAAASYLGPRTGSGMDRQLIVHDLAGGGSVRVAFEFVDRAVVLPPVATQPAGACRSVPGSLICTISAGPSGSGRLVLLQSRVNWPVLRVDQISAVRVGAAGQ
jgi:hypothetical protein